MGAPNIWLIYNCEFNIMLTHSLIQYLTLPATPPSPVALAAGVRFIHKARLYEREIKDSLSPITRIVTVSGLINMTVAQQLFLVMRILIHKRLKLI